jgi:hypothetical protein
MYNNNTHLTIFKYDLPTDQVTSYYLPHDKEKREKENGGEKSTHNGIAY